MTRYHQICIDFSELLRPLVKKVNEHAFIFFDPNFGEFRQLDKAKLADKIRNCMKQHCANDLFFLRGSTYLDTLRKKIIL